MKCVANITVEDESRCFKKCSGLVVTTYDKMKKHPQSEKFMAKLSNEYWKFKASYKFPDHYEGTLNV